MEKKLHVQSEGDKTDLADHYDKKKKSQSLTVKSDLGKIFFLLITKRAFVYDT